MQELHPHTVIFYIFSSLVVATVIVAFLFGANNHFNFIDFNQEVQPLKTTEQIPQKPKSVLDPVDYSDPKAVQEFADAVEEQAVATTTLVIGRDCSMSPLVLKATPSTTLTVINADTVPHSVSFQKQGAFSLREGSALDFVVGRLLSTDQRMIRYQCKDLSTVSTVGIIYVTYD